MGVEQISPAAFAELQNNDAGSQSYQSRVPDLQRMEQDVRKMKTEYRQYAKENDLPQNCVIKKMMELNKLISNIEQQIARDRQNEISQSAPSGENASPVAGKPKPREQTLYSMSVSVVAMGAKLRSVPPSVQIARQADKSMEAEEARQAAEEAGTQAQQEKTEENGADKDNGEVSLDVLV